MDHDSVVGDEAVVLPISAEPGGSTRDRLALLLPGVDELVHSVLTRAEEEDHGSLRKSLPHLVDTAGWVCLAVREVDGELVAEPRREGTPRHVERQHHHADAVDLVGRRLTRHRLCREDVDDLADQDDIVIASFKLDGMTSSAPGMPSRAMNSTSDRR